MEILFGLMSRVVLESVIRVVVMHMMDERLKAVKASKNQNKKSTHTPRNVIWVDLTKH